MALIYAVEDDKNIRKFIQTILEANDYDVIATETGKEAYSLITSRCPDVVILDLGLPDMDGMKILKEVRAWSNMPIIVVSARDHEKDKVEALDMGADDYITKPFGTSELLARIRALSRRQGEVILEELTFNDLTLNLSSNDLSCKNKSIHLGYKEFEILKILMSNPKILISKETLIVKVWGAESAAESNNVEAYISFLRKKFHYLDSKVTIGTVRKVGYRLESEETS